MNRNPTSHSPLIEQGLSIITTQLTTGGVQRRGCATEQPTARACPLSPAESHRINRVFHHVDALADESGSRLGRPPAPSSVPTDRPPDQRQPAIHLRSVVGIRDVCFIHPRFCALVVERLATVAVCGHDIDVVSQCEVADGGCVRPDPGPVRIGVACQAPGMVSGPYKGRRVVK